MPDDSPDASTERLPFFDRIIAETNEGITYADFVAGIRNHRLTVKVMKGYPYELTTGIRKFIFRTLAVANITVPIIAAPFWAYHESNWLFLMGILCSISAISLFSRQSFLGPVLGISITLWWVVAGFDIHSMLGFFSLCFQWSGMVSYLVFWTQTKRAIESLLDNPDLFQSAVSERRIMIFPPKDSG